MKTLLAILIATFAFAIPAHAGLYVGGSASYQWVNDLDFNNYNAFPSALVGFEVPFNQKFELDVNVGHPFDITQTPNEWFKRGRYGANAVLKIKF